MYFVQIERSNVAGNGDIKTLGISYKNLETKKSKIAKGEYAIKMGKSKIGFFFVRDVGTIKTNPMGVIIDSKKTRLSDTPQSRKQQDAPKSRQQLPSNWAEVKSLEELNLNEKEKKSYKKNLLEQPKKEKAPMVLKKQKEEPKEILIIFQVKF